MLLMISDGGTKHSIKNALANTSCLAKAVQCLNTPSFAYQGGPEDVTGGEDITPLNFEEARKWYENANNDDEKFAPNEVYEREFEADNLTDDPVDTYSIRLHKSTKIKLQRMAQQQKTDQSKIIENLINNS